MTWPLFALVQLALTAVGLGVVLWLRNRALGRLLAARERETAEAAELLQAASERFEGVSAEARGKWLDERVEALDEDDPVERIQKLVLQNEKEPIPGFAERLGRRLAAGAEGDDEAREEWLALRTDTYRDACRLIERFPRSHSVVVQIYDAFAPLDVRHEVDLPPLPEPVEREEDEASASEVTEQLRAANDLLNQQLADAQAELATLKAVAEGEEQEEDLKALLQQFTRDSRDMMACIQELEQENRQLRERLEVPPAESHQLEEDQVSVRADDAA